MESLSKSLFYRVRVEIMHRFRLSKKWDSEERKKRTLTHPLFKLSLTSSVYQGGIPVLSPGRDAYAHSVGRYARQGWVSVYASPLMFVRRLPRGSRQSWSPWQGTSQLRLWEYAIYNLHLWYINDVNDLICLFVAGEGFEPPTSRLWAWQADLCSIPPCSKNSIQDHRYSLASLISVWFLLTGEGFHLTRNGLFRMEFILSWSDRIELSSSTGV